MQNIAFVGKIYGLEADGKPGKDGFKVKFRLGVRKKYVSEEDKKAGNTQVFVPLIAFGKTAELINEYFQDGSVIGVNNLEYTTWTSDNNGTKQYFHNFKVGGIDFIPTEGDANSGGGGSKSSSKSSSRRDRDDDRDDDRGSSRRSSRRDDRDDDRDDRSSRRSSRRDDRDDDRYDDRGSSRSRRREEPQDIEDDDLPF